MPSNHVFALVESLLKLRKTRLAPCNFGPETHSARWWKTRNTAHFGNDDEICWWLWWVCANRIYRLSSFRVRGVLHHIARAVRAKYRLLSFRAFGLPQTKYRYRRALGASFNIVIVARKVMY